MCERGNEKERCGGKSLNCLGWTRAVWDIGNGYIFQYHFSILRNRQFTLFAVF